MKAIDTNILVRFLTGDDKKTSAKAHRLLQDAHEAEECFAVMTLVVLELIWVLDSGYGLSRDGILNALETLLAMPTIAFESPPLITNTVAIARAAKMDLADILIGLSALERGCETTLTFDKQAAKSELFELI